MNKIRYAKFINFLGVNYLVTIDDALDVIVYDYERPKVSERGDQNAIVYHENLTTAS